jgi:hypothetical protein
MSNQDQMVKCAVRALLKLAQENHQMQQQLAKHAARERALSIAKRLAELGSIETNQIFEKAASLESKNLDLVEEAMKLDLHQALSLGTAVITKEAKDMGDTTNGRQSFENFLLSHYG